MKRRVTEGDNFAYLTVALIIQLFAGAVLDQLALGVGNRILEAVTVLTLGYGDMTPVLPVARFLAYMEAVVGQFYIAIVVASLVGAHLARRQDPVSCETR
jgi:uncharacterized membrane protein